MSDMLEYPVEEIRKLREEHKKMKELLVLILDSDALRSEDEELSDMLCSFMTYMQKSEI
jgi:hypothetical protein